MSHNTVESVDECDKMKVIHKINDKLIQWKITGINLVYAIGCCIIILASFLPYVYCEQQTMSLMEGNDGIFFLMIAVLIFIFIAFEKKKITGVIGIVMVYLGTYELIYTFTVMSKSGQVIDIKAGYYVLLMGILVMLAASSYFVYRNGLKDIINKVFDRFFPVKATKEQ